MKLNKLNILQNFKVENYFDYPYPFFEIENALPEDVYAALRSDYSIFNKYFSQHKNFNGNNKRVQINSETILKNENDFKKSIWYDFIKYHNSIDFFEQLINIFDKDLIKIYPFVKKIFHEKKKDEFFLSYRSVNNNNKYEFVSDCQPGINTATIEKSSVRGPHVDNPVELFGGLFYLRDKNDKSIGGDLIIYEKSEKIIFHKKAEVQNVKALKQFKKIKYKENNCIFFLNTKDSIHSVSERSITNNPRNLTNLIFERYKNSNSFFTLDREKNLFKKLLNKINL
tara:strand:+ start:3040 stop:3888 length:849 start_codon:yes stop_codon:yes gene_type:complete